MERQNSESQRLLHLRFVTFMVCLGGILGNLTERVKFLMFNAFIHLHPTEILKVCFLNITTFYMDSVGVS